MITTSIKKTDLKKRTRRDYHPTASVVNLDQYGQEASRVLVHPLIGDIEKGEVLHRFESADGALARRNQLDPIGDQVESSLGKEHEWMPCEHASLRFVEVSSVYEVITGIVGIPAGLYVSTNWAYQAGSAENRVAFLSVRDDGKAFVLSGNYVHPKPFMESDLLDEDEEPEILDEPEFDIDEAY